MADLQPTSHDKAPEMPWGLHLIADATSEIRQGGVAVDIITVHGLGAYPDHAWVRHKDTTAGLQKDVRWLTDLLPQTFRNYKTSICARVFCFNYQSAWLGPQLSKNRLEGLARRLLDDIHNVRNKNDTVSDRPIIFIGHSFGGLVIEQAVVQANSAGIRYEYLVKLIGGIVLLGTPHQGSKSQKWGSIVASLANLIDCGETGLMNEVDEKSMKIFHLISEFKRIMISMDLAKTAVICFYENLPTNYLTRVIDAGLWIQRQTSSMVVEETSAVLSGFDSMVLDSDHLKLNKFASAQDGNYVSVSSNLCRIATEAHVLIQRRRAAETASSYFLVPRELVKNFIGRESLLDKIWAHFSSHESGPPPCLTLHALGGQGKTQIALKYCRKWRTTYPGIFWIDANSEMTVTQSYAMIAAELMGPSWVETNNSAAQIRLVRDFLEGWDKKWLLVFDNYDEPDSFSGIRQFIPTEGHGHVLFTSRNRDLSRLGTRLEIPPMTTGEGVELLLRGYDHNEIQQRHKETASSIINRLGNLALAIDQAAAYINYKRMPLDKLEDFLITYEDKRRQILSHIPKKFWEYRKMQSQGEAEDISVFTTWEMSFQQLESGDEPWEKSTGHFLTLSAFFAPIPITESLFRYYQKGGNREVEWIQMFTGADGAEDGMDGDDDKEDGKASKPSSGGRLHGMWDADRYWDVIVKSDDLSLLQSISSGTGPEGARFSLHPLIRDWLQLRLQQGARQKFTQEAIKVLTCYPGADDTHSTTLKEKTALMTHMDVSMFNWERFSNRQDSIGLTLESCETASWFASFNEEQGRYLVSEIFIRRVLETRMNLLSEEHPSTLGSACKLAELLDLQGKFKEAEPILQSILHLRERTLGEDHIDTLLSKSLLAKVLFGLNRYEECEEKTRQVLLALIGEEQGKAHDASLTIMNMGTLALVLKSQNKYEEGERIFRQTLSSVETLWDKERSATLPIERYLAAMMRAQDKDDEVEQIYRRVLTLRGKTFGNKHPDTMKSMGELVYILWMQGKMEEAERLCRQILMLRESTFGKNHPDTMESKEKLVDILSTQCKWEEAERLCRQTLMLREKAFDKTHPDTMKSMERLVYILWMQGKWEEAEPRCRQVLMLRERVFGKKHLHTLQGTRMLATILRTQGKMEDAEPLFRQALILIEMILGKEHPGTMEDMERLVDILREQGKMEEAEPLCRQVLMLREGLSGKEHPDTLQSTRMLAMIWSTQGKMEEAERLFRQALMLRERVFGKEHPATLECTKWLTITLRSQGKMEEAERIFAGNAS